MSGRPMQTENRTGIVELPDCKLESFAGGPFFVLLVPYVIIGFGAGYAFGRDMALRDRANEAAE